MITSTNVMELLKDMNVGEPEGIFVPDVTELEFADDVLYRFAKRVSEAASEDPGLASIWFGGVDSVLAEWNDYRRIYVGYTESSKRYILIYLMHPSLTEFLEATHFENVWKQHLLVYSDSPDAPKNPMEVIDVSSGEVVGYRQLLPTTATRGDNP